MMISKRRRRRTAMNLMQMSHWIQMEQVQMFLLTERQGEKILRVRILGDGMLRLEMMMDNMHQNGRG